MRDDELVDVFADALREVGLESVEEHVRGDTRSDILIDLQGRTLRVELKRARTVTSADLSRRLPRWQAQLTRSDVLPVLVADTIVESARALLRQHGWGWLDLRGHLHLTGPGVFVDTAVLPLRKRPGRHRALSGVVGLEVACKILLDPDKRPTVRRMARELGRSASTVSDILAALRDDGLIDAQGMVNARDLFWRVADLWPRKKAALASLPVPGAGSVNTALRLGLDDVESSSGWAMTDTLAAAHYGAPVGVRSDYPPDFYVPTSVVLGRALQLLGRAADSAQRQATIQVAPVPMVCDRRIDPAARNLADEHWPLTNPLFVALDLAGDPGRGSEILQTWEPPRPWRRVW
ncbi:MULTISPECIES: hypothetical protein [unclassified Spirillospora]|uniref:hypothetical protein n=1 Tax=unclassified Spirillospora TaxID=2642701 RepID=UPI00371B11AF